MVSVVERDAAALGVQWDRGGALLDRLAGALQESGLHINTCRQATTADAAELGSSWAKRLGIPARRPAWMLEATKSLLVFE